MLINIPKDVAQRLEALVKQEGSTIGDMLVSMLDRYAPEPPVGTLAEMARI